MGAKHLNTVGHEGFPRSVDGDTRVSEALEFRSEHDVRWDNLGPEDAADVRLALVAAHKLRQASGSEVATSYLEAFAVARAAA